MALLSSRPLPPPTCGRQPRCAPAIGYHVSCGLNIDSTAKSCNANKHELHRKSKQLTLDNPLQTNIHEARQKQQGNNHCRPTYMKQGRSNKATMQGNKKHTNIHEASLLSTSSIKSKLRKLHEMLDGNIHLPSSPKRGWIPTMRGTVTIALNIGMAAAGARRRTPVRSSEEDTGTPELGPLISIVARDVGQQAWYRRVIEGNEKQ